MKIKALTIKIITLTLAFLIILTTTSIPTIAKEYQTLKYFIEVKDSVDNAADKEFDNTDQYVENYKITFYDESDDKAFTVLAQNAKNVGEITLEKGSKIKLKPKKINPNSLANEDSEIELPIFANDSDYEAYLESQGIGNHFILRSVTTNLFYLSNDADGNKVIINKDDYLEKKNEINSLNLSGYQLMSFSPSGSATQNFTYMYSSVYAYDEYNSARTQKRHKFDAYHLKFDTINEDKGGYFSSWYNYYVSTTSDDTKSDVAVLAWTLGGAINSTDSSIYFHSAYNKAIKYTCLGIPQPIENVYRNLYKGDSGISKHDTAFNGTSIAYNMPDYITVSATSYGEETLPVAAIEMGAIGGWYNVGSYNGANGVVRSEYIHSFSNNTINVSLGFSFPASIGVSVSGASTSQYEKAWVYTTISPN